MRVMAYTDMPPQQYKAFNQVFMEDRAYIYSERKMVNFLVLLKPLFRILMKVIAGMRPQSVEIEPGTVMHFWVPTQTIMESQNHDDQSMKKRKNKPGVVLLHGFAGDGFLTWMFQIATLTADYTLYIPDLLFFGESFSKSTKRSPEFQAECVVKGLKKLGVERFSVVGFSYGGPVGFKMVELYPNLVRCLVLSSSVVPLSEAISRVFLENKGFKYWTTLLLPETVEGLKLLLTIVTYWKPWFPDWVYRHYLEVMVKNRKERVELLELLVCKDKGNNKPDFSQNIHLIFGDNDRILNIELARCMKEQLGDKATLHFIKKAGHLAQIERPFAYNSCLKKILASLGTEGPQS
ncbi:hypothetical protein L1049_015620 [Liquidambar formosana]|uniref:AB hydrolase-1 domain-containing protein n=1 Tax=Liquidambar formosana TaxID=63359 RepID=A0AAP0S511_LIQFO